MPNITTDEYAQEMLQGMFYNLNGLSYNNSKTKSN